MSTAMSSYVLIINLTGDKPRVLRRFDHHRLQDSVAHDRVIKGRGVSQDGQKKKKSRQVNGNGRIHVNGDGDIDMAEPDVSPPPSEDEEDDSEDKSEEEQEDDEDVSSTAAVVSVDQIAVSTDGQWLATSDDHARTHIYNLDLISVRIRSFNFPLIR